MRHRIDRRRFASAVINGDPDLLRRYATSPTFKHGVDAAHALVETLVAGLLVTADEVDAEHADRIREAERDLPDAWPVFSQDAVFGGLCLERTTEDTFCGLPLGHSGGDHYPVTTREAAEIQARKYLGVWGKDDAAARGVLRWSGVIALEGTPTEDGRVIAHGALHWSPPVRLQVPGQRSGVVRRIWREGGFIWAEGDCEQDGALAVLLGERGDEGVGVAVEIDQAQWVEQRSRDEETLTCSHGRVCAVTVVASEPAWPATRIRIVEGTDDGR